jgi:hypothetical protein
MIKRILHELKAHAPFTAGGALLGIFLMIVLRKMPENIAFNAFYVFHPLHVVLSALVTTSMYHLYRVGQLNKKVNIWLLLIIGYVGSVGVATVSDSVIPYLAETLLKMPLREIHLGFIERWWIVNPLAFLGIAIAYFIPRTKFPHGAHILVSTAASLLHIMMAEGSPLGVFQYGVIFIFLFLAVWVPCCLSDIVFPLLFVRGHKCKDCCG